MAGKDIELISYRCKKKAADCPARHRQTKAKVVTGHRLSLHCTAELSCKNNWSCFSTHSTLINYLRAESAGEAGLIRHAAYCAHAASTNRVWQYYTKR